MTFEERKLLAKINSTFGNLLFISDNVSEYTPEHLTFANKDIKINKAQFGSMDIMDIDYSENGVKNQMRFNIRTGEMLI